MPLRVPLILNRMALRIQGLLSPENCSGPPGQWPPVRDSWQPLLPSRQSSCRVARGRAHIPMLHTPFSAVTQAAGGG